MNTFVNLMDSVAKILNLNMVVKDNGWYLEFSDGNKKWDIVRMDLGLNSSSAVKKAKDKSLAYKLMNDNEIPAVEHYFIKNPFIKKPENSIFKIMHGIAEKYNYNVVLKPNDGGSGNGVVLIKEEIELDINSMNLFNNGFDIAISPFYEYENEYRVVVLDGKALISFSKRKVGENFKHNISEGSIVEEIDSKNKKYIEMLAEKSASTLGLRFCTVDVIGIENPKVLEVNSLVSLKRVADVNLDWFNKCVDVYSKAFKELIE